MKTLILSAALASLLVLAGCDRASEPTPVTAPNAAPAEPSPIDAAIAGAHRSEQNRARDRYRHPKETLEFFGIEPGMTVVELYPGAGWYTEVLGALLAENGKLIGAQFPATAPPSYRPGTVARYQELLASPGFERAEMVTLTDAGLLEGVADGSVDAVLTFRNVHNWMVAGNFDTVLAEAARVLKPGGVFGVVEHRAAEGVDAATSAERGYVPESYVIERAQAAGLVLEGRSEINANPNDTKDYARGVWELPPALRGDEANREAMLAIGESDRMTLRFVKPADR